MNGTKGLSNPRECRRVAHQKYVTQVNAVRPSGHPDASYQRVNPDTGSATDTTADGTRCAPYSRARMNVPSASKPRIPTMNVNAASDKLLKKDIPTKIARLIGFQIPVSASAAWFPPIQPSGSIVGQWPLRNCSPK